MTHLQERQYCVLTVQSSTGVSSADNYDMKCQIGMWKEKKIAQYGMRKLNYGVCGHKVLINQLCQRKIIEGKFLPVRNTKLQLH